MVEPSFADYVSLLYTLFERFLQQQAAPTPRGHPWVYRHKVVIVFFMIMQCLRIFQFKTQHRWLTQHPERRQQIGLEGVPDRSTLSRRYKAVYPTLQAFIAFLGQDAPAPSTPRSVAATCTRTRVCSKRKARCGINPTVRRGASRTNCAI